MQHVNIFSPKTVGKDLLSGMIVFLVALPLCLGIALASGAPLFSGLIAGIVGGIVVGIVSGSHTSVSGPAAGLTAIVLAQITKLGSFEAFLLTVMIGGIIQIGLGIAKAGALSAFFPTSVIKGLLAAIGLILILKQIPHLLGHDANPEGEMAFQQPDHETTFSELGELIGDVQLGAAVIGLLSVGLLVLWSRYKPLKNSLVPAPLIVVLVGTGLSEFFRTLGGPWAISSSHLVQVPVADDIMGFFSFLQFPDFSQLGNPAIYVGAFTIAIVSSLESLLNLQAADNLDPKQRVSPPSRELFAQGVGNVASGLLGGLPVTTVIVRSSVNIHSGAQTRLSAITHGSLLCGCVMLAPAYLNLIPLSSLAAILLVTGFKLASPAVVRQMWNGGRYQFLPFVGTVAAIVLTDLLIGIVIGLAIALIFILASNLRRPIRRIVEKHIGGEVLHVELANQVSFLNRAALSKVLDEVPPGSHVLLDARRSDYIDPDILSLIRHFKDVTAPVHDIQVSCRGFRDKYQLEDEILFVDYATRELHERLTPAQVLKILREGNERFVTGRQLDRNIGRSENSNGVLSHPMAIIFSGIDSRSPTELIFDLGLGDVFTVRIGGNVVGERVLGSMEYACRIGGAKLILVMGHTGSSFVTHAVENAASPKNAEELTGCRHLEPILLDIQRDFDSGGARELLKMSADEKAAFVDSVARRHVIRSVKQVVEQCGSIRELVEDGKVAVVGAMYDVRSGRVEFLLDESIGLPDDGRDELEKPVQLPVQAASVK